MWKSLYQIGILGYSILIWIFSFFNAKAKKFLQGRKTQTIQVNAADDQQVVWFHVSSLGEFEQARPVIESLKLQSPSVFLLLTFFSPSGYEIRKSYDLADKVYYLPLDTRKNARKFLKEANPHLAIFVKYDFWLNYLQACHDQSVPVIYISSIFKRSQHYFSWLKQLYLPAFQKIDHFFVQDIPSENILKENMITQVSVAGDTRFDRVASIAEKSQRIEQVEKFLEGKNAWVLGSVWPSDMEVLYPMIRQFQDRFRFIIAPHNIEEAQITRIEKQLSGVIRYSQYEAQKADVLIIDNIGMLSSLYQYGRYAYIGGAFRGGLHNVLEAAVYGIPVFFGRHEKNKKFNEAIALLESGGAFDFENDQELKEKFISLDKDPEIYREAAAVAYQFVRSNRGATQKVMDAITLKLQR
jgi:3-deoxy-D-manno-octulosonic-acid transferase